MVAELSATDPDYGDDSSLSFSIQNHENAVDDVTQRFRIVNNTLVTSEVFNFEELSYFFFSVVVSDLGNLTDKQVR